MALLSILFFITAILYSSVGFGGGSTYLALLLIWGVPYFIFPIIALSCIETCPAKVSLLAKITLFDIYNHGQHEIQP